MTYTELTAELENAPSTWMPGLLVALVSSAYRRGGVFVPGGAGKMADRVEAIEIGKLVDSSATPETPLVHGKTCPKYAHFNSGGYLHGPFDDGPYDVDDVKYCGRCHHVL